MNEATKNFINDLKKDENVSGVILFGSWARGNNREDSDVDLVVIVEKGYQRTVENHNGQDFEIIYTTATAALEYWKNNPNDAANLWEVAIVVFDRNNIVQPLESSVKDLLKKGKKEIDTKSKAQLEFSGVDTVNAVTKIAQTDIVTANLVLDRTVITLTEQYFDIRQLWTPAPKQRIIKIKEIAPDFYSLLQKYYQANVDLNEKVDLAKQMTRLVFA